MVWNEGYDAGGTSKIKSWLATQLTMWSYPMAHPFKLNQYDKLDTPPKFNIAPEKWWLEDYIPIGKVTFRGLC